MYRPTTNIKMVDVIIEEAFWDEAKKSLNRDAWFLKYNLTNDYPFQFKCNSTLLGISYRCYGPNDMNAEINKKSFMKTIKDKACLCGRPGSNIGVDV